MPVAGRFMFRPLEGLTCVVAGAGVAGLTAAVALAERGARVTVFERSEALGLDACSSMAGGMLAPFCEQDGAEPLVTERGRGAVEWWSSRIPGVVCEGTLVVAAARDRPELARFASRTQNFAVVDGAQMASLEPDLAGRFDSALWFASEAHLDPRVALAALARRLRTLGGAIEFGQDAPGKGNTNLPLVDCRGMAARGELPTLRGVRGEMVLLRTTDVSLRRPVRLLHPRTPAYVIPRGDGLFMLGATSIESEHAGPVTARSAVELLNAAYAIHPAFADAEIVEFGVGVRPAFPDNLPAVVNDDKVVHFNGLYRHGFLLSPWYAEHLADNMVFNETGKAA